MVCEIEDDDGGVWWQLARSRMTIVICEIEDGNGSDREWTMR